ncbi:glycosyltransferase [soil metagenome]
MSDSPNAGSPPRARVVALFVPSLVGGGGERITLILARDLRALGYEVDVVVGTSEGPLRTEVPADVELVDLGQRRLRSALPPLVRYLRRRRPDCILPTIEHANVLAIMAVAVARTPTKVMPRVANTLSMSRRAASTRSARLTGHLVRRLYRHADVLVACSHGMADDLAGLTGVPRGEIRVIPNAAVGADLPALARQPVDHPWLSTGDGPVIVAVGRLSPQKNFRLLLDAFALVRRRLRARLVILGEGDEREALTRHARSLGVEDDVDLHGFDQNPYRYMARADVFALSSDWEGLPGVLIEALACGASVVATDCPSGPREILEGGRYGRLVPPGRPDRLASALEEAIGDDGRVPDEAWRPYTGPKVARRYATLIDATVAGR